MTTVFGDFARRNEKIKSIKKAIAHFMFFSGADIEDIKIVICSTRPATIKLLQNQHGIAVCASNEWKNEIIDMMITGNYYSFDELFNSIPLDSFNRRTGHWGNISPSESRGPGLYDDLYYFKHKEKKGRRINLEKI